MRKQIAAANWKMNLTLQQAETLIDELLAIPHDLSENQSAIFGVPFPYLTAINNKLTGRKNVFVSAQNCYNKKSGAIANAGSILMKAMLCLPKK